MTHASAAIGSRAMFVIYDTKAEAFGGFILLERHPAAAVRTFTQLCFDKTTQVGNYPADFVLLQVGFIEDSGQILPIEPMEIVSGSAIIASHEAANAQS
ncbi:MAG: nonstructural protein [Microvirus sp.]|nr:MAG: nonstructural protein [Microvirus sp.]